jgi:hypothetical protein
VSVKVVPGSAAAQRAARVHLLAQRVDELHLAQGKAGALRAGPSNRPFSREPR